MFIPDTSTLLAWAPALLVLLYVVSALKTWYRLRNIPGPFLARFSYIWDVYYSQTGQLSPVFTRMHDKYGPLVRIGPNYVVTNDPDVWRQAMSARSRYVRDEWWKASKFHPEYENVSSIRDNDEHDRFKAKTASGYSGRENGDEFEPAIDSQIAALVTLIRRKYLSKDDKLRPVDMAELMRYFTLDTITRLSYGKPFGHLDEGEDLTGFVGYIRENMKYVMLFLEVPLLRNILFSRWGLRLVGPKETDKMGPGRMMGLIHERVNERFQAQASGKPGKWNDMIGGWIRKGLTQQEIEGEANLQILAGTETSATVLSVALMCLAATPHAYARLKREIRNTVTSTPSLANAKPITYEKAQHLPYLHAVIWEAFRMRTPVNYGHYKVVPPEGDTFHGVFLPGGTALGHNALGMSRNRGLYGEDVEMFRPERFLESEVGPEVAAERLKGLDVVFGGGRWMCSGKQVAMFELYKGLFELMRTFEFQVVNPRLAWREMNHGTPVLTGMWARVSEADWE